MSSCASIRYRKEFHSTNYIQLRNCLFQSLENDKLWFITIIRCPSSRFVLSDLRFVVRTIINISFYRIFLNIRPWSCISLNFSKRNLIYEGFFFCSKKTSYYFPATYNSVLSARRPLSSQLLKSTYFNTPISTTTQCGLYRKKSWKQVVLFLI